VSELLYLHWIADPSETLTVKEVFVLPLVIVKLSASCASVCTVQLEPPLREYSAVTYDVDPELFCRESVEVEEPAEQLPSDCEAVRVIAVGQSTVLLVTSVPDPENVSLVEEVR
jgi:hypothetical protein